MSWTDALAGTGSDPYSSDNTYSTEDYSGDPGTSPALGVPTSTDYSLAGDSSDNAQMGAWNPAPAQAAGVPWWQGAIQYGVTKAIDNAFPNSPTGVMGNVYPGSGAGTNGRTYTQRPQGAGGGIMTARIGANAAGVGGIPVLWLLIGAAALLAFH